MTTNVTTQREEIQAEINKMLAEIATFGDDEGEPLCTIEYTSGSDEDEDGPYNYEMWDVSYADGSTMCHSIEDAREVVLQCLKTLKKIPQEVIEDCRADHINPLFIEWDPKGIAYLEALTKGLA